MTDEEVELQKIVKDMGPQRRKALKDELAKWPDPPGEEEFKGPYNGPEGEELRK
jgi:hypothetical protein